MKINKYKLSAILLILIVISGLLINHNRTSRKIKSEANVIIATADSLKMNLWNFGTYNNNEYEKYLKDIYNLLKEALEKYQIINDKAKEANTLHRIGDVLDLMGKKREGLGHLEEALSIYIEIENKEGQAAILHLIGTYHWSFVEIESALSYYKRGLSLYRETNNLIGQASILWQMGFVCKNISNYTKSLEYFTKSLKIAREMEGMGERVVHTLNNIGEIYIELAEYEKALEYFQESLAEKDLMAQAYTFMHVGLAHKNLSHIDTALYYFEKSLSSNKSYNIDVGLMAKTYNQMAEVHYHRSEYSQSIDYCNKSFEIFTISPPEYGFGAVPAYSHLTLAQTFIDQKKFNKAKENIESALNIALALNHNSLKQKLYSIFGDYYAEQNLDSLAIEKYKKSIEKTDIIRDFLEVEAHKSGFMIRVIDVYKKLIAILIKQNRKSEAFKYLEQMKARVLLDILNQEKIDYSKMITPAESKTELSLISSIEKLTKKIHSNQQNQSDQKKSLQLDRENKQKELTAFQENLFIQYQGLREKRGRGQPIDSVENAQDLLDTKEAAIYFLPTQEYLFTFILTKEDFSILTVDISMDNINLFINQLLKGIKVLNWNIEHSKILYEILIEPITDIIKDKETLCIIPEGKLNYVPFQALLNSKRQKYLIEDYAIYYSPSLSSLKWLRTKIIKENKKLLAFGDCDFSGEKNINTMREKLIALPATGEEVKALNVIYSPNANIFLGSNATESNFNNQSTKFGIIHLATHSLVNEALPLFSSIAFSKENGEDGFLEAREIIQMELNAQLVILSACKTAFGKQIAGEGMLGLTRAFFTAGIPSVVASLWEVEDNATKVLMVEFHKRIKEGNTPDLALKGAQIYMIKNSGYTDPLFWSPFILVGDNQ